MVGPAAGEWVVVEAAGETYLAEVVFGPRDVLSSTDCRPVARIVREATRDDMPAAVPWGEEGELPLSAQRPAGSRPGIPHPSARTPRWTGVAPRAAEGRAKRLRGLLPTAGDIAGLAGELLAIVEEHRHGVRGFGTDLPALGAEITLSDGRLARVMGIDGRHGRLHAGLPGGEETSEPLPQG
jgi:hypothetical protein